MMWIVRLALRRPYTFVVFALLILIVGIFSIETMRIEEDGSVLLRTWWEPQGEMLEGYAAGQEP